MEGFKKTLPIHQLFIPFFCYAVNSACSTILVPEAHLNWKVDSLYFRVSLCVCVQTFGEQWQVAMYAPNEPVVDYNMVIIFLMAVGTVAVGGYWAGSRDIKK